MKIPKGFHLVVKDKMPMFMCDAINNNPRFLQVFTTRKGGKSLKQYGSLNTGMHTGDDIRSVNSNIRRIENTLGVKYASAANQVHGDRIVMLMPHKSKNTKIMKSRDAVDIKRMLSIDADGIISDIPGIAAGVRLADCAGTVIMDPVKNVTASIHSGWKGVANKIPSKAVKKMKKYFGSNPGDLTAAISPAIGPCCYEVGAEIYNQLQKQAVFSNIFTKKKGRIYMDLWAGVKNLLVAEGLKPENVHVCDICTSCNPEYFYSHRRDKGKTGRQMAIGAVIAAGPQNKERRKL
jgi:YfiH family protein